MKFSPSKIFPVALLFLICGAIFARAEVQGQRWLLVFDTSAAMKKRLPAVETEIKTLFASGFGGKISDNDSIGVWTLGEKLKTGGLPDADWDADNAPAMAGGLVKFLHAQDFSGSANPARLQPLLGQVIGGSERLTIVIFCDGTEHFNWSPYTNGINSTLQQTAAERKKSQQPTVVVFRTQLGKFSGATVNFPPAVVAFPPFPLLPREMKPVDTVAQTVPSNPPPAAVPPPKPTANLPALIIVGTRVSTNVSDLTNTPPVASAPASVAPKTNPPPAPVVAKILPAPPPTNLSVVAPATNALSAGATNLPPTATVNAESRLEKILTGGGIVLLLVALALVVFLLRRKNSSRGSLITSSLENDFRPPRAK
jgi:hypothetical protein